jgi:molybdopterin converting factor small subunit
MPGAVVRLPRLLEPAVGDVRKVEVKGETFRDALDHLFGIHPTLRVHLLDEQGALRPHVLCFLNGEANRELADRALAEGDEITFLQAVSGG